ncbi:hypothetical protein D9611_003638 [Ephemerocybe angulata]|uniref:Glucose receptor Git3 N-terminal domain-containing protein n=1 Tax=Ephemerocybe angulata TaxID=980116 RepID=A0A8H5B541_9AGAR|nr:hypothetical protein D9611_003638 [Tulosesus angulatus]
MSTVANESGTGSEDFTFPQRVSMLFVVEAASLSAMSIIMLVAYKLYRTVLNVRRARASDDACDSSLFLSLMLGEALRATGKIMSVRWIVEAKIIAPTVFCTAQGLIQLIGTNIIDWSTLAITIQTWVILVAQWNAPVHFAKYLTLAVWVIVTLIVGITFGVRGLDIIGPAGSWCWITSAHKDEQIAAEYFWMWMVLILTIVFYGIDVLVIRGYLALDGHFQLHWVSRDRVQLNLTQADTLAEREKRQMALQLFFYPVVYFVTVLPQSITRWMAFSGHKVPHQAAAFTNCLFCLSGLFNVILFFVTRPQLITGGDIEQHETKQQRHTHHRPQHGQLPLNSPSEKLVLHSGHHADGSQNTNGNGRELFLDTGYKSSEVRGRQQFASGSESASGISPLHRNASHSPGYLEDDDDEGHLPPM